MTEVNWAFLHDGYKNALATLVEVFTPSNLMIVFTDPFLSARETRDCTECQSSSVLQQKKTEEWMKLAMVYTNSTTHTPINWVKFREKCLECHVI